MIVHLPHKRKYFSYSTPVPGIERVEKMNILGITVSFTLFHHHISDLGIAEFAGLEIAGLENDGIEQEQTHAFKVIRSQCTSIV